MLALLPQVLRGSKGRPMKAHEGFTLVDVATSNDGCSGWRAYFLEQFVLRLGLRRTLSVIDQDPHIGIGIPQMGQMGPDLKSFCDL